MRLEPISEKTAAAFSCALVPEPQNPERTIREQWYRENFQNGAGYFVLLDDEDQIIGKCQTVPIECSPFVGEDLLVILCLYVHMYEKDIGDQRKKGYGCFMLNKVEEMARGEGYKGIAVWAMDWDWNPVSFYLNAGWEIADQEDKVTAVWKPFSPKAKPPKILRYPLPTTIDSKKVQVVVVDNAYCAAYYKLRTVRTAIQGVEEMIEYVEAPAPFMGCMIHLGYVGGVFLDGEVYKPYEMMGSSTDLREEIIRRYWEKNPAIRVS